METTTNNQEKPTPQGKTLIVSQINHRALSFMKIEGGYSSIDELVSKLIESHNKLAVMELANKKQPKKEKKTK